MATLKDVAQKACVDVSTVSRALNNTSYVHPETKARIVAAAKELGYRPNVMAKALRQGRRHTLGVIVPRLHLTLFSEILPGIEHEAERLGYSTLISTTDDDPQREKSCLERMQNSFVDGIIITGTGRNNRLLRSIQASGIAVTQIVRCTFNASTGSLLKNNLQSSKSRTISSILAPNLFLFPNGSFMIRKRIPFTIFFFRPSDNIMTTSAAIKIRFIRYPRAANASIILFRRILPVSIQNVATFSIRNAAI